MGKPANKTTTTINQSTWGHHQFNRKPQFNTENQLIPIDAKLKKKEFSKFIFLSNINTNIDMDDNNNNNNNNNNRLIPRLSKTWQLFNSPFAFSYSITDSS